MISQDYLAEMAAYNRWQNDTLFALCDDIGEEERQKDRGLFFGSIHRTLDHILMVNEALLLYLDNKVPEPSGYGDTKWANWEDLKTVRATQDQFLIDAATAWDTEWLATEIIMNSPRMVEKPKMQRWVLVVQLFQHAVHHRAQATSGLHAMGIDYGNTDIPFRPGAGFFPA